MSLRGQRRRYGGTGAGFLALLAAFASIVFVASPVPASAAGPSLADSFARADNWQVGTAETGQFWQGWNGTPVIRDQRAAASVPGYSLAVADAGGPSGTVGISVPVISDEFWMVFRASDPGNYWRFGRWQGGPYQLQQIAGWALGSPVTTSLASMPVTAGDRLECNVGSGVTCSVNGTPVVTSADSFNPTATMVGFAMADPGAVPATRFDDISFVPAAAAADVAVQVSAAASAVTAGSPAAFTVTVSNVGTAEASGVSLSGTVPAGLSSVTVAPSAGTCTVTSTISCAIGSVPAGGATTIQVAGTTTGTTGTVTLSMTAAAIPADASPGNDQGSAAISVDAAVSPDAVVGDNFARADSYSLGAAPTGQVWQGWGGTPRIIGQKVASGDPGYMMAVVDSGLSAGSTEFIVPAISSDFWLVARASNNGNYWRFGSSGGSQYQLEQINGWALASPQVEALAAVSPAAGDKLACRYVTGITCSVNGVDVVRSADSFNSAATHVGFAAYGASGPSPARFDELRVFNPPPASDLIATVTSSASSIRSGLPMSWTATIRNAGSVAASGVTVTAPVPAGLSSLTVTPSAGSCALTTGIYACSVGSLPVNATATITYATTSPSIDGSFTLTVSTASQAVDGDGSNNAAAATISVSPPAGPGEFVSDDFNRADATLLGQTGGRSWRMLQGTVGVVGQQAAKTSTLPGLAMTAIDPGFAFGTMDVTLASGADQGFYVLFRAKDSANQYRLTKDSSGFYRIQKLINGQSVGLQFNAIRANVVPANGDRIRLVVRPDDGWFVSVNGVHILDGGDVEMLSDVGFGLASASPAVRFDDVHISQLISTGITTSDTFTRPDGTNIEVQAPSSGTEYRWLTPMGYWENLGGQLNLTSPGFGLAYLETSSSLANVQARFASAGDEAWLVFRYDHDGSYYRFGYSDETSQRYTIQRVDASGEIQPVPGGVVTTNLLRAALDLVEIRQDTNGQLQGYVNGVQVATAADPVNSVRGSAYGFAGSWGAIFDDLTVTPK